MICNLQHSGQTPFHCCDACKWLCRTKLLLEGVCACNQCDSSSEVGLKPVIEHPANQWRCDKKL